MSRHEILKFDEACKEETYINDFYFSQIGFLFTKRRFFLPHWKSERFYLRLFLVFWNSPQIETQNGFMLYETIRFWLCVKPYIGYSKTAGFEQNLNLSTSNSPSLYLSKVWSYWSRDSEASGSYSYLLFLCQPLCP